MFPSLKPSNFYSFPFLWSLNRRFVDRYLCFVVPGIETHPTWRAFLKSETFSSASGHFINFMETETRPNYYASLISSFMTTNGQCVMFFYMLIGRMNGTISVISRREDLQETVLKQVNIELQCPRKVGSIRKDGGSLSGFFGIFTSTTLIGLRPWPVVSWSGRKSPTL